MPRLVFCKRATRLGVLLLLVLTSAPHWCQADVRGDAQRLFEIAEAPTPKGKSRLAIQQQLAKAEPAADADSRLRLAYGLTLIHEKKYADSITVVNQVVAKSPKSLGARQAKAWLLLASRKPADALSDLEAIAALIALPAKTPDEQQEFFELAQFLGTALAYCEGPGAAYLKKPAVTQTKARVLQRLTTEQRAAFDVQAAAVAERFAELEGLGAVTIEQAKAKKAVAEETAAKKQAELEKADVATKAAAEKTSAALEKQYETLSTEHGRLRESHSQTLINMASVRTNRANLAGQLASLTPPRMDRNGSVDRGSQSDYDRQSGRLSRAISGLDGQIARLAVLLDQQIARGKELERQMALLIKQGQSIGAAFAQKQNAIGKKKSLATKQQTGAAKMVVGKSKALVERQRAYLSYDDFPYAAAKERLLASLSEN